ncbi:LAMI_0G15126g1_1 [Lachancea mirantina]|uniref:LAMI_0G15126g1_1 n=1 Tax=Lachancea mirantina TaxID=1230905 RepID=A0A1G4KCA9_9SACH|nr:LAMI_0G15126g1_1 [Lachancea mirantina]
MPESLNIAIVLCSSRKPRVCPQIARFVKNCILDSSPVLTDLQKPELTLIDLEKWNLPLFDESGIPSQIKNGKYDHEHTRAWSREIQKYDGFIFVVPQYNWGYPAVVKNAIDFLYHEWSNKAALVVSYGGHGGSKCNAQLTEVLQGVKMIPVEGGVQLAFPDRETLVKAVQGAEIAMAANDSDSGAAIWSEERKTIAEAFQKLLDTIMSTKVKTVLSEK